MKTETDNSVKDKNATCDNNMLALGRLTTAKLIDWVNFKFKELEILNFECYAISRTFFSQNDYECGACKLVIQYRNKSVDEKSLISTGTFVCYYRIKELEWFLKNGYELCLKDNSRFGFISNFELDVRKT